MATQYSNKPIVTDGLVYALDFGNPKSYVSGSSTAQSLKYDLTTGSILTFGGAAIPDLENGLLKMVAPTSTTGSTIATNKNFSEIVPTGDFTIQVVTTLTGNIFITQGPSGTRLISRNTGMFGWYLNPVPYGGGTLYKTITKSIPSGLKHITYRYSSGSYDLFVNGIPVPTTARSQTTSTNTGNLTINGRGAGGTNLGTLDIGNFYIYNRALTSDEIYSNYLIQAQRYGLPTTPKPYSIDENAYLFLSQSGITDPIITSSIDTFVRGLKSNNLWDKMIAIYPFVGTGSDGVNLTGSHSWNLKEPTTAYYKLGFNGSWNGSTSGSAPSGSGTYITTGVAPYEYYPFKSDSNQHISILSYDTPASSSYLMGTGMTEELAVSTLAGDYGTPAAAYSVRKVRTAYSGALMDVRRSLDNVTSSIGYVETGDLDTGSLLDFVIAGRNDLPGEYEGLAAAYSLRKVSASYDGPAIEANNGLVYKNIGFTDSGVLDTASLDPLVATGSNVLPGEYSGLAAAYSLRKVNSAYTGNAIQISSSEGLTKDIGFDTKGNLDTGSLLNAVTTGSGILPGQYDGLAAAYSLRKVSASYDGFAVKVRGDIENQVRDIGFDTSGDLDTDSLLNFTATGSNTLAGNYSGLAAAYSLRRVSSSYSGDAIEVQSGSVSQSIGFDSLGNLDTGSLLTFAGSGDAFVKTWYDQSGNNNHATQSVAANQPQIVSAGSILVDNNKPTVTFDGVSSFLKTNNSVLSTDFGIFAVAKTPDAGSNRNGFVLSQYAVNDANRFYVAIDRPGDNVIVGVQIGSQFDTKTGTPVYDQKTYYWDRNGSTVQFSDNSASLTTSTNSTTIQNSSLGLGGFEAGQRSLINIQEAIIYSSSQATNRTYIENNINAYYDIYTTSSTSTENAYVSTWYDQSGNGNHATQTATGSQPLIVSSGSLTTENGKPALSFDGVDDFLLSPSFTSISQPLTTFTTTKISSQDSQLIGGNPSPRVSYLAFYGEYRILAGSQFATGLTNDGTTNLIYGLINGSNTAIALDGGTEVTGNSGTTGLTEIRLGTINGTYQEALIYSADQSSNRTYIENNINAYYDIYNPTSGTTEDAYVSKWYDQSGNNNHATQSVAASQPRIVYTGSIVTQNGKPALDFNGSQLRTSYGVLNLPTLDTYTVFTPTVPSAGNAIWTLPQHPTSHVDPYARFWTLIRGDRNEVQFRQNGTAYTAPLFTSNERVLMNLNSKNSNVYVNSTVYLTGKITDDLTYPNSVPLVIAANGSGTENYSGNIQELVFYNSDQSSNRTYIENNINAYYDIYTTSSTSTENAYVNTWYDQSGNGRHATQTATGSQPLIVENGSLITENGKPAFYWNQNGTFDITPFDLSDQFTLFLLNGPNTPAGREAYLAFNSDTYQNSISIRTNTGAELQAIINAGGNQTLQFPKSPDGNQILSYFTAESGVSASFGYNNVNTTSSAIGTFGNESSPYIYKINSQRNDASKANSTYQELIVYSGSQAANRPLIENNINNYYNIYTGSNHGFVERWYDQSGNDNHAVQTATGSQPIIVESGSVIFSGDRPAVQFAASKRLGFDEITSSTNGSTIIINTGGPIGGGFILGNGGYSDFISLKFQDTLRINYGYQEDQFSTAGLSSGLFFYAQPGTATGDAYHNSQQLTKTSAGITSNGYTINRIGGFDNGSFSISDAVQEIIIHPSNQSSNRGPIEYNINNYYNIYPQTSSFTTSSFTIKADSTSISGSLNNKLTSGIQSSGPLGLVTVSRTGSDSLTLARNGAATSFTVPASGALSTGLYLGAINNNGLALGNSPLNLSFASVGTGLTNSETSTYFNLVNSLNYRLGRGVNTEYDAVLEYAILQGYTLPSVEVQAAQNQLLSDLKSAGIWNKLDVFFLCASDGDIDFASIDWKNLGVNTLNYSTSTSTILDPNKGLKKTSAADSGYIEGPLFTTATAVNVTTTSAAVYVYEYEHVTGITIFSGFNNWTRIRYRNSSINDQNIGQATPSAPLSMNVTSYPALKSIQFTSPSAITFTNNTTQYPHSTVSTAITIPSSNYIRFYPGSNVYGTFSLYAYGASLLDENTAFSNAMSSYLTAISS